MEKQERNSMDEKKNTKGEDPVDSGQAAVIAGRMDVAAGKDEAKINYRGWKVMPFIIGNETFEKLGAIGTLANLLIYLTKVFNMKSITAANTVTIFNGTTNLSTLVGAFFCDTFFGRYTTIAFCSIASYLGLQVIQLTAAIKTLHPPHCAKTTATCVGPSKGQMAFLITGFALLITGAAGIRPCNLAFGADQFNPKTEAGKRGVNSFFNWYFFTFTFAQMVSLTLIVYVQSNVSWAVGLAIPAALMLVSCAIFFSGSKLYVKVRASGSPMTSVVQVVVAAFRKCGVKQPEQPWLSLYKYARANSINSKLAYTDQFRFLDKAGIMTDKDQINSDGSPENPWRLCSIQQIEEVKCLTRVLPIWLAALIYYIVIVQMHTYAIFQATQSDRRLGNTDFKIPAATFAVFLMLSLSIFIPIYDRLLVPFLRRLTGKEGGITILQRMGIGFFISILAMLVSGFVESQRRHIALTIPPVGFEPRRGAVSSMSALWLAPQFALAGLAEAFANVGQVEFYYKQFPENMRSIAGSLFYCGMAGANYLSSFLITVVHKWTTGAKTGNWLPEDLNEGRLEYYYYMIAGIGVVNLGYFLVCARWYKYKGAEDVEFEAVKHQEKSATA